MLAFAEWKSISGRAEGVVNLSPIVVYDFIVNRFFENYPKWCPQVVSVRELSDPPMRVGTQGRQLTRDRGIENESTFEVSTLSPIRSFELKGLSEPFKSSYAFMGEGSSATRISFTFELEDLDLLMRPFQKLIRSAIQEGADQTVENIRRLLEQPTSQEM
jgi:hypothetical protein